MAGRVTVRSGWRCVNDGPHDWYVKPERRHGKNCRRCHCTEAAPAIWIVMRRHPERGVMTQHCHSFAEAIEAANDEWCRRNLPGYNAPPLTVTNLGGLLVAAAGLGQP